MGIAEAEIHNFYYPSCIGGLEEQVFRFEITVRNFHLVEILYSINDLCAAPPLQTWGGGQRRKV